MDKRYSKGSSCRFAGWAFLGWLLAVGESGIVKRFFYTATRIHPALMARPLSKAYGIWSGSYSRFHNYYG